ncbi:hypothetical protein JD844_013768 [Phrynosoma platyrhinos]|uniref:KRAB domain-containing protein n=1 Tax=Phrynosoma platyrhinos TaxID=52577 RepID=A0ABQ7TN52_PHRPL|nr:hypothetical protein JD844_013768 [Phrynosoma platyrhinos]
MRAEQGDPVALGLQLECKEKDTVASDVARNSQIIQSGSSRRFWERQENTVQEEDIVQFNGPQGQMLNPYWREEPFLTKEMQNKGMESCSEADISAVGLGEGLLLRKPEENETLESLTDTAANFFKADRTLLDCGQRPLLRRVSKSDSITAPFEGPPVPKPDLISWLEEKEDIFNQSSGAGVIESGDTWESESNKASIEMSSEGDKDEEVEKIAGDQRGIKVQEENHLAEMGQKKPEDTETVRVSNIENEEEEENLTSGEMLEAVPGGSQENIPFIMETVESDGWESGSEWEPYGVLSEDTENEDVGRNFRSQGRSERNEEDQAEDWRNKPNCQGKPFHWPLTSYASSTEAEGVGLPNLWTIEETSVGDQAILVMKEITEERTLTL